jgi:hypothetical protein
VRLEGWGEVDRPWGLGGPTQGRATLNPSCVPAQRLLISTLSRVGEESERMHFLAPTSLHADGETEATGAPGLAEGFECPLHTLSLHLLGLEDLRTLPSANSWPWLETTQTWGSSPAGVAGGPLHLCRGVTAECVQL